MILRPFRVNEAWWAGGGAVALVAARALAPRDALGAVARGLDVYLFLAGMMALAEFAREEGVFDWIAGAAVRAARGSRGRLLLLVYAAGVVTTAFLSNDATIVVLTPAVVAAMARTDARPEPFVFACALVANAASLVLPIANPANLLFFAERVPPLGTWFASFGLASVASVVVTYAGLAFFFRRETQAPLTADDGAARAPRAVALVALAFAAAVLVATSSLSGPLGITTFALGAASAALAATRRRDAPIAIARGVAWSVVVLTAALFVLVDALDAAGGAALPRAMFAWAAHASPPLGHIVAALATAVASNVVNNLPVALDVGKAVGTVHPAPGLAAAALAGVNVGPNFTVNGSLATLLWLAVLRREGIAISGLRFAAVGAVATPAALVAAALLSR